MAVAQTRLMGQWESMESGESQSLVQSQLRPYCLGDLE